MEDENKTDFDIPENQSTEAVKQRDGGTCDLNLRCEVKVHLASTDPPRQQTLLHHVPSICFPFFDPNKLQPIDLTAPMPVTRLTFNHPFQNLMTDVDIPFAPSGSRARDIIPASYCRNQLRLARRHALLKIGVPTMSGERKLMNAVKNADVCTVIRLLQDGMDPNTSDNKKRTPLHIAASQGLDHVVSLLVAMRADANRRDILGNTPLHLAACRGDSRIVKILIGSGADVFLKDNVGRSPLCIVRSRLSSMRKDRNVSTDKLKCECQMIMDVLKAHINQPPDYGAAQIDALCYMMGNVSTREQADEIADAVIDKMSDLSIANAGKLQKKQSKLIVPFSVL